MNNCTCNSNECTGSASREAVTANSEALSGQPGAIWGLFAEAISHPDDLLVESVRSGSLVEQLQSLLVDDFAETIGATDWQALTAPDADLDAYSIEYTRLFDKAAGGKSPLYSSVQFGPQMKTLEEIIRFYRLFGIALAEDEIETPDHLSVELSFVQCLAYGEADLRSRGEDAADYGRARRDFIARFPGRLLATVNRQLASQKPKAFIAELFKLLEHCLHIELNRLESEYGEASTDPQKILSYEV